MRGLSLSHAGLARLLGGELRTGTLIGLLLGLLGLLALPMVWAVFGELHLAIAVAPASASMVASVLGLLLP